MKKPSIRIKEKLNQNSLINLIHNHFASIDDSRDTCKSYKLSDMLMSAYAIFSLKSPSLIEGLKNIKSDKHNLQSLYNISRVPSDTQMREVINNVDNKNIRPIFKKVFLRLQRAKELEKFRFMGEYYLISGDGTEYFKSQNLAYKNCLQRKLRNGNIEYYNQIYAASIVHPDIKQVIPLAPEPILKQDGSAKQDCERNASKRWLNDFKKDHPKLKAIIIEDSLSSNAPHIKELRKLNLEFILGVKEKDHKFLFDYVKTQNKTGNVTEHTIIEDDKTHIFSFINDVPLNASNQDVKINFLEYWEINNKTGKKQHFSWVTDFKLTNKIIYDIMRGGRARWKIENETFNTLKNQGYYFDHNFGHGDKYLSTNFILLMMLAFLTDQTCEISCNLFKAALKVAGTRTYFWKKIRRLFDSFLFDSMNQIYEAIFYGIEKPKVVFNDG